MLLPDPSAALELLEETINPKMYSESLLASAYQMSGDARQAVKVLQTGIYTHLLALLDIMTQYLSLCSDNPERQIEVFKRISETIRTFDVEGFHPAVLMNIYLASAQSFAGMEDNEKALELLGKYTDLVTGNVFPLKLRGDDFFYLLDEWFEDFDLGTAMPRDEKTVRQSICDAVANNPAFAGLKEEYRFQSIIDRLNSNCEGA